jgi:hypothetical protein
MIYTARCVMLLMRAETLRGEVVGGLALEISSFWAPNVTRLSARAISQGPTKLEISSANPPTTSPRNVSARIKSITHGAV